MKQKPKEWTEEELISALCVSGRNSRAGAALAEIGRRAEIGRGVGRSQRTASLELAAEPATSDDLERALADARRRGVIDDSARGRNRAEHVDLVAERSVDEAVAMLAGWEPLPRTAAVTTDRPALRRSVAEVGRHAVVAAASTRSPWAQQRAQEWAKRYGKTVEDYFSDEDSDEVAATFASTGTEDDATDDGADDDARAWCERSGLLPTPDNIELHRELDHLDDGEATTRISAARAEARRAAAEAPPMTSQEHQRALTAARAGNRPWPSEPVTEAPLRVGRVR